MSKAAAAAARATVAAGKPSYTQVGKTETECKPKQAGKSWPPSLRNFVERAFLRCKSPDDRKATEVGDACNSFN